MRYRVMQLEDYDSVLALWKSIEGFYIYQVDDSFEGLRKFLQRNPYTNTIAEHNNQIIGSVLCGYDGRCAYFYHVCVRKEYRHQNIGKHMVEHTIESLRKEGATHINLIAFKTNEIGNLFWHDLGWSLRDDANLYSYTLDSANNRLLTH